MTNKHLIPQNKFIDYDSYDNDLSLALCKLSGLAYKSEQSIKKVIDQTEYENFQFFDNDGCQAFCITDSKHLVIVFRGTQVLRNTELKDFWPHFTFKKALDKGYKLHKGYYEFYKKVRDQIKNYVTTHGDNKKTILTGHQLGGTLAQIAGEIDYIGSTVYAFGATRAISPQSKTINKNIFSITLHNDVVSNYPSRLTGLIHIGNRLTFNKYSGLEKATSLKNTIIETALFSFGSLFMPFYLKFGFRVCVIVNGINAHHIDVYRKRIENYDSSKNK